MSKLKVDSVGNKRWGWRGRLHRLDGPALELVDGHKAWYKEGKLHRLDGPAKEWINGDKAWYKEGKLHRLDGPALDFVPDLKPLPASRHGLYLEIRGLSKQCKGWWIEGERIPEENYHQAVLLYKCRMVLES